MPAQGWDNWWAASRLEVWPSNDSVWSTILAPWWPWRCARLGEKRDRVLIPKHIPELYIEKKNKYTYIYVCVYIYIYIYPGEDISWVDFHGFPDFERKQAFRWRVTFVFQALEHTKNQRTNRPTFNYHLKRWLYEIINNYILYTSTVYIYTYIHTWISLNIP